MDWHGNIELNSVVFSQSCQCVRP